MSTTYHSVKDFPTEDSLISALHYSLRITDEDANAEASYTQQTPLRKGDWLLQNYDVESSIPISVEHEAKRLSVLQSYSILDSETEKEFDFLVSDIRKRCSVPWAILSFVDLGRQWFKATSGDGLGDVTESSRCDAFCSHTILHRRSKVLVISDTLKDSRFEKNPLVQSFGFRFYAGAQIVSPEGYCLGSLCVLDNKPHEFGLTKEEQQLLESTASEVVDFLVQRRKRLNNSSAEQKEVLTQIPRVNSAGDLMKRAHPGPSNCPEQTADTCIGSKCSLEQGPGKRHREDVFVSDEQIIVPTIPKQDVLLPDPSTPGVHPDDFLSQLTAACYGLTLKVVPALELEDFFPTISEQQMLAYKMEIVAATRENNVEKLRALYQERGRASLDCFNRFGEGLLNMACRRGFKDIVEFLLSKEVNLSVRIRDDYGRTPLHDACWNPEPQLEICERIIEQDPSLFFVCDKRGYTPFQYARKSDWRTWRHFLFDNRDKLQALLRPDICSKFS